MAYGESNSHVTNKRSSRDPNRPILNAEYRKLLEMLFSNNHRN